mmetsp:Transcript_15700/g.22166  ORF Transcript_15700/g.22166 Transcript_15700/m.22166 type:complete len:428 (-) Transcript_15700:41-1324(-)|eukprot:CAMPEP_0171474238 /NCGR_PEP_ID=MMETSP0946-20130122/2312_1 /TAXON_ID=109269 /ORGANISM="Vaucheria litorea, Strain CCMP2940" /LENGTH=427 /DNA_ID=CAMNT_0012004143 /DNA_START=28 /DNA_END=1311 /DNA_ORIENTATION=+
MIALKHVFISIVVSQLICCAWSRVEAVQKDEDDDIFRKHIKNLIESISFEAPFTDHGGDGKRIVKNWIHDGSTSIKQSFIRLTPDMIYSAGQLWSTKILGTHEFSLELKFRVSGKSEKSGGEYLSMWITDRRKAIEEGTFYGIDEFFTGIGFIIDTKRDTGDTKHRDVSIVWNNGKKTNEQLKENISGCNMNIRYWEGRDDFNVLKSSRIRAKFSNNKILVDVDSRNTGRWRRCATINDANLPHEWAYGSFVGFAGLNFEDSSNKDLLALRVYKDPESAWAMEKYAGEEDDPEAEWAQLVHHMEHEMFTVQSSLKSTIYALESSEAAAAKRITALEERLSGDITRRLEDRLRNLETQVHRSLTRTVHNRVTAAENQMVGKIESTITGTLAQVKKSWRYPFYFLVAVVGAMCMLSYFKYKELRKQHLL